MERSSVKCDRPRLLPLILFVALAGCDTGAGQLVEEIDAAREGCTSEMLEAGAEKCVQMFEKYIEMGTGAIETYIGALKTFDAAVDRGPEIRFDTVGVGHAISPELRGVEGEPAAPIGGVEIGSTAQGPGREPTYSSSSSQYDSDYPPRYTEPARGPGSSADVRAERATVTSDERRLPVSAQPAAAPRGAILPPTERLRRPWIGDEERSDDYYPDADPGLDRRRDQTVSPGTRRSPVSERSPL